MLAHVNIRNQHFQYFWRFFAVLFDLESFLNHFEIIWNDFEKILIILDHEFYFNHNQIKSGKAFFSKMNLILS